MSADTVDAARAEAVRADPAPVDVEQLGTPVLSVRRTPTVLSRDVVGHNLRTDLAQVVDNMGPSSCLVVESDGIDLVDERGAAPVIPASNMKLLTAAVALEVLGPDAVFTTQVAANVVDGVVSGDVFLIGGGDPLLSVAEYPESQLYPPFSVTSMEALADRVVLAGVRRITGAIVGDDSRYDDERYVPSWATDIPNREAGPIGALLVNDGRVYPRNELPGQDPAEAAAEQLQILLERRGVEVGAEARRAVRDAAAPVIASVDSVPLAEVVHEMLTTSDDNTAESLLKEIGLARSGAGTRAAGAAAVLETLATWGLPTDGMVITDGSGLDRTNVLTCELLVGVLEHVGANGPVHDSLPIAGTTGTLVDVFVGTPLQGKLRAKTGTLSGAKSLSGYYPAADGSVVLFSLILNGEKATVDGAWPALWTDLGNGLSAFPSGPAPDALAPRP
ncbi:MAG: D-alanyl-D-alanine carboxypeptidase/D-alanyl-D-alanine-endopeptidase [Acidimicrobiia bacterium]